MSKKARTYRYGIVKSLFAQHPNGLTIKEACGLYASLYPGEERDIAGYICSQHSFANFKVIGMRDGSAVYVPHTPTKEEKILSKIAACDRQISQGQATKQKMLAKLAKLKATGKASTEDVFDFDPNNIK